MRISRQLFLSLFIVTGCAGNGDTVEANDSAATIASQQQGRPFRVSVVMDFNEPWAMVFLPGGEHALITEKSGALKLWRVGTDQAADVGGVPAIDYGGQGGLGDVALHPDFANNGLVYLSYAEAGEGRARGAAVGRGRLVTEGGQPRIEDFEVVWRQQPKVTGNGHYGHRIAFSPDGRHLFISSGDRQKFDPAQDMNANLGKILRLDPDGGVPADNPFADRGGVTAQIWSIGHRNPLGIAFDAQGRLWEHEMGPSGGDEFNLIERGSNYGYPIVSDGDHYDGRNIPDHATRPEFNAPEIVWTPVVSPSGLIRYDGALFPAWRNSFLLGGLSGQALVRIEISGNQAREAERWDMGARIREVEQGPDGAVYLLEDESRGSRGRLLRLTPSDQRAAQS